MQPGSRKPAPDGLALVQAFINTNDIEAGRDELSGLDQMLNWFIQQGIAGGDLRATEEDLQLTVSLREHLRALALANNGETLHADTINALNAISSQASVWISFDAAGHSSLQPQSYGTWPPIATLLAEVHTSMASGTWSRLKVCRNHECRWAFYDHSRNRSGAWCTMSICGSRNKTRAYRRRRQPVSAHNS